MKPITSWLVYIKLRREDGARIFILEFYAAIFVALTITVSWGLLGMPSSFSKDGLIDGLGSISTVLAGFFVAGLVAIATFFRENSSLDDVITNGPVILGIGTDDEEKFTRRQYVCSIFGFLVGISFFLAISSTLLRAFAPIVSDMVDGQAELFGVSVSWHGVVEWLIVFLWMLLFVWQIILTLRGLYYLMDRIYDLRPTLGKPKSEAKKASGDSGGAKID